MLPLNWFIGWKWSCRIDICVEIECNYVGAQCTKVNLIIFNIDHIALHRSCDTFPNFLKNQNRELLIRVRSWSTFTDWSLISLKRGWKTTWKWNSNSSLTPIEPLSKPRMWHLMLICDTCCLIETNKWRQLHRVWNH